MYLPLYLSSSCSLLLFGLLIQECSNVMEFLIRDKNGHPLHLLSEFGFLVSTPHTFLKVSDLPHKVAVTDDGQSWRVQCFIAPALAAMAGATLVRELLLTVLGVAVDRSSRLVGGERGEIGGDISNRFPVGQRQRHWAHLGTSRIIGVRAALAVPEIPELANQVGFRLAGKARGKEFYIAFSVGAMASDARAIQCLASFRIGGEGQSG